MTILTTLQPYRDDRGNEVVFDGPRPKGKVSIRFNGRNNRLVVGRDAKVIELTVTFGGDGSVVEIGTTTKSRSGLRFEIRVGHDSGVRIGENVGSQGRALVRAVEGTDVVIGDDCMLAAGIEIRTDDTHAIYDVRSGKRLNVTRSVSIGEHVWIAKHATIMGGTAIGAGAVIGFRAIVTSDVPNNAVVVGAPARVVKRDVAWERPELTTRHADDPDPFRGEKSEQYWNLTDEEKPVERAARLERPVPVATDDLAAWVAAVSSSSSTRATGATGSRGMRRRVGRVLRRLGLRGSKTR